ncbi:hypothetical protein [Novosphingobium panipatense]|uniref:hypothetical protein n=1 Tax=Novosphingobium panipatense TaxID=428991 RepID=UPI0036195F1D
MIEIVVNGQGAALLPETMIRDRLAAGTLREVLPRPSSACISRRPFAPGKKTR